MAQRKRDPSFSNSEKIYLLELVEKYFHVIECKKTDSISMKRKIEEWQKLAHEFNAVSSIYHRDWAVLKNCWENLKKRAKQINTMRNQHFLGTGGGPPKKIFDDPATEKTLDLIKTRITGYINCFDSDGTQTLESGSTNQKLDLGQDENLSTNNDTNISESLVVANGSELVETPTTFTVDWSQYTPSMLRETINPALVRPQSPAPDMQQHMEAHVEPENNQFSTQDQHQEPSTSRANTAMASTTSVASTSRRRPTARRERETQSLTTERIKTLLMANRQAVEEHSIQMNILRLQEEKEKEMLAQEKLKTEQEKIKLEILKLELTRK